MKQQVIKADTLGCMVKFQGDSDVYYIGEKVGDGFAYQYKAAFKNGIGICYIPYNSFMDDVEMDENVPDELFDLIARKKVPSGAVAMDDGFTLDDLRYVVNQWVDNCSLMNDVNDEPKEEFIEYFTGVLFANLVTADPCDYIEEYNAWNEYMNWLQVTDEDPRLTSQQRKELGYE